MSRFSKWLQNLIPLEKRDGINTIYFTFFLLFVVVITLSRFYFWKTPFTGVPFFFFLHAIGQCFLETGLLLLIGSLLKRWMPRWLFYSFIGFSFAVLLAHFADFTIGRLMDSSISYIFNHFFGSGISHLIPAFQSLNMNGFMIVITIGAIVLIPFIGIAFYCATDRLSKFIPWRLSMPRLVFTLLAIGSSLFALDLLFHPFLHRIAYSKYQKALPMGTTFIQPTPTYFHLPKPLAAARDESHTRKIVQNKNFLAASRPNIYLFVIETLRNDFITEEIAPNFVRFAKENISFKESFSNANASGPSWFAIFHSDFPYHWPSMRDTWENGSIPLNILKNIGYKISVLSSADLRYYNMDQLLFGKNRQAVDRVEEYTEIRFIEPSERDGMGIQSLFNSLETEEGRSGNLFILFLDATHSEYSFPPDFPLKFLPICKEIDYLTLTPEKIEPLKNRYRNSIAYVDSLLERFFQKLKEKDLYDHAVIAITGDHGEEFFEEDALFHGTHLNSYQTSVPIFYKFESNPWIPLDQCTTHLDIFPSIIHYLTGRSDFEDLFDGQSIFAPNRYPYRLSIFHNGPYAPCEFAIENKDKKYLFRFSNPQSIYDSKELEVILPLETTSIEPELLAPLLLNK